MKLLKTNISVAITTITLPLVALDMPRSFPPAIYSKMESGSKLDKLWISSKYIKLNGFSFGGIHSLIDNCDPMLIEALSKNVQKVCTTGSSYKIEINIVKFSKQKTWLSPFLSKVVIEGNILDSDGSLLVAFHHKQTMAETIKGPDVNYAADKIVSALLNDLLKIN